MRYLLMLPPALSHLLFCAHLLYQGAPLWVGRAPVDRFTALGRSAFSSATNADAGASLLRH